MLTCTFENGNTAALRHVVVDTLVLKAGSVLLVKRAAKLLEGGKWGLVGGYVERDETTAEAAAREVLEETGYTVKDITLLTIRDNPDRPHEDRQNISFVYFCTAGEKVGDSDEEVTEQKWFSLTELPKELDLAFDHAVDLALYQTYLNQNRKLPFV